MLEAERVAQSRRNMGEAYRLMHRGSRARKELRLSVETILGSDSLPRRTGPV